MIENRYLFLKEFLHGITEADTASKIFIIEPLNFVEDWGSSALCNLAQKLCSNLMSSRSQEGFLKIVIEAEICNEPFLEEHAYIWGERRL